MRTEIEIIMPESWADVTLEKYLALQKDLETYKDNESFVCFVEKTILSLSKENFCYINISNILDISALFI